MILLRKEEEKKRKEKKRKEKKRKNVPGGTQVEQFVPYKEQHCPL